MLKSSPAAAISTCSSAITHTITHTTGIHLFGLNTDANAAGIDIRQDKPKESAYVDWKTVVWRNRQLGFNAVRLPFNFFYLDKELDDYAVPCNVTSREELIAGVTPPNVSTAGKRPFTEPPVIQDGTCNADMPDTYLERLVWSICYLTSQDMYVAIDHHLDYSQRDNTSTMMMRSRRTDDDDDDGDGA